MVSIVVPVYNGEKYIKSCVDSLINQTYRDIEIILVNDGSKDNTGVILEDIKKTDNRICVVHKENGGVSSARNAGIAAATGKYVMFCDCDDTPDGNWCEELVKAAELYSDRLPICGIRMNTDVSEELCDMHIGDIAPDVLYVQYDTEDLFRLFRSNLLNSPCNKIYLIDIIKSNNVLYDTRESMGEDLLFNLQYISFIDNKIVYVNKLLYTYIRQNTESLSRTAAEKDSCFLDKEYVCFRYLIPRENNKAFDDMNEFFFYDYIDLIFRIASEKSLSKSERNKITQKIIDSKLFRQCVNNVNEAVLENKNTLKLARNRFKLKLRVLIKIFL